VAHSGLWPVLRTPPHNVKKRRKKHVSTDVL
jgi:hypothetical protein